MWVVLAAFVATATDDDIHMLQVLVKYPTESEILRECEPELFGVEITSNMNHLNPKTPARLEKGAVGEWHANVSYTTEFVGRTIIVSVVFRRKLSMSLPTNQPLFSGGRTCFSLCPAFEESSQPSMLGSKAMVDLKRGMTTATIIPWFCQRKGESMHMDVTSPQLGKRFDMMIHRPPSMIENPYVQPIIVFAHDGLPGDEPSPVHDARLLELIDESHVLGLVEPLMIVAISSSDERDGAMYRNRIFLPSLPDPQCHCQADDAWWCQTDTNRRAVIDTANSVLGSVGQADLYLDFLYVTVRQHLISTYGLEVETKVANWGYGLGGFLSMYATASRPLEFPYAFAGSPTVWWNCGELLKNLNTYIMGMKCRPKIYMDVGGGEGWMQTGPTETMHKAFVDNHFQDGKDVFLVMEPGDFQEPIAQARRALRGILALFGTLGVRGLKYPGSSRLDFTYSWATPERVLLPATPKSCSALKSPIVATPIPTTTTTTWVTDDSLAYDLLTTTAKATATTSTASRLPNATTTITMMGPYLPSAGSTTAADMPPGHLPDAGASTTATAMTPGYLPNAGAAVSRRLTGGVHQNLQTMVSKLEVTVLYPTNAHVLHTCKPGIFGVQASFNMDYLAPGIPEPLKKDGDDHWKASLEYEEKFIGKEVTVTVMMALLEGGEACHSICPSFKESGNPSMLGSKPTVILRPGETYLTVRPWFCERSSQKYSSRVPSPQLGGTFEVTVRRPPSLVENPSSKPTMVFTFETLDAVTPDRTEKFAEYLDDMENSGFLDSLLIVRVGRHQGPQGKDAFGIAPFIPSGADATCVCPQDYAKWCNSSHIHQLMRGAVHGTEKDRDLLLSRSELEVLPDKYLDFIYDTLRPHLTEDLRLTYETTVAMWGYGLAGLLTLYAATTRPSQFTTVFAGSPSLWWNCGRFASALPHSQALNGVLRPKIYIDIGGAEGWIMTDVTQRVHETLIAGGCVDGQDTWLYIEPGDYHDPIAWTRRSVRGLLALFGTRESQGLVYGGATSSNNLYAADMPGQVSRLWQRPEKPSWSGIKSTLVAVPVVFGFFGMMGAVALLTIRQQLRLGGRYESMGSSASRTRTLEMTSAPGSHQLRLAPISEDREWVDL